MSKQVYCEKETKKKKQNFNIVPIVVPIVGISILLLSVAAIWLGIKRRRQNATIGSLESRKRQFAYSEILTITNNLEKMLGKAGFGAVYYGCIDKTETVKMLSPSSVQGPQQFHAEVDFLLRVHHINLISLVGYCNDKTNKGLVYEYMANNGNLQKHLSGSTSSNVLTWEGRLQIAIEAAQGLEYMHHGCTPPTIQRDVKSSNILLNENFQAKISDFGLSRNFTWEDGTHIFTGVDATPGYLGPEEVLLLA